jgi:amidase
VRRHAAAYDRALTKLDALVMPTLPIKATPIPPPDAPKSLVIKRAHEMFANTAIFDSTGHPAVTVPCGLSDGLPVGLMLVGTSGRLPTPGCGRPRRTGACAATRLSCRPS